MKEEELLRNQVNELIRDEIQDVINDYVESQELTKPTGLGFVSNEESKEFKVNVANDEVDKIIKEYKKIKKGQRSNLSHIKKLGLLDKHGRPLK